MMIITEKKKVTGTLKTRNGTYKILSTKAPVYLSNQLRISVVDDEGFDSTILVHGDYVIMGAAVPEMVDVKRILTDEEVQGVDTEKLFSDEPEVKTTIQ